MDACGETMCNTGREPGTSSPQRISIDRTPGPSRMRIRLAENFRALFYAPYYAAQALGLYAQEGAEVEFLASSSPSDAVAALHDGTIDLTWGGPMRVMRARDQDPASPLTCFCEVVARDPFFLVGHGDRTAFTLADLQRLRFARVSEVLTPWMCLQHDLRVRTSSEASVSMRRSTVTARGASRAGASMAANRQPDRAGPPQAGTLVPCRSALAAAAAMVPRSRLSSSPMKGGTRNISLCLGKRSAKLATAGSARRPTRS